MVPVGGAGAIGELSWQKQAFITKRMFAIRMLPVLVGVEKSLNQARFSTS